MVVGVEWVRGRVMTRSHFPLAVPVHALVTVGNVEEKVLFVVFLVQQPHGSGGGWNDVVYKEEQSILRSQVNSFPDEEVKLSHCKVRGDKVFLLVQISYSCFGGFLHNYWNPVGILLPYFLALGPSLLEGMLLFVLKLHG